MMPALANLRKELAKKGFRRNSYSVGKLPADEGHCILQEENVFLVFYYERGNRFEVATHMEVNDAIVDFKEKLRNDPYAN